MYNSKLLNIRINHLLFYSAYSVWLVFAILSESFYYIYFVGTAYLLIRIACLAMLLASALLTESLTSKRILSFGLVAIASISIFQASVSILIDTVLFIYFGSSFSFRSLAKCSAIVLSLTVAFVVASSIVGIIPDYISNIALRVRHYLGFRYSLRLPQFLFTVTALFVYLKREDIRLWQLLFLIVINLICYVYTNSRLSFYLSELMLILFYIVRNRLDRLFALRITRYLTILVFPLVCIVSIAIALLYDPSIEWMSYLDSGSVLSGRIMLSNRAIENYGITLFGQNIDFIGNGLDVFGNANENGYYNYVDSLYIRLLVQYGIVFLIVFLLLMMLTCNRACQACNYVVLFILVFIALHCMVDDLMIYLYYNPFLFLIGCSFDGEGNRPLLKNKESSL